MNDEKGTFLVVDDENVIRDLFSRVLKLRGYKVEQAKDSKDALMKLRNTPFDIIFLDVMMPKTNGLETYKRIRRIKPRQPVVLITGFGPQAEPLVKEALALGARGCLSKPFDIAQVINSIKSVMGKNEDKR